jgi:fatty acid desaturase
MSPGCLPALLARPERQRLAQGATALPGLPRGVRWADLHREIVQRMGEEGVFEPRPWGYAARLALALSVLGLGFCGLLTTPAWPLRWLYCAAVAFALLQGGMLGHDVAHRQVTRKRLLLRVLGQLLWSFLLTHSFTQWRIEHELHHRHTNESNRDPDLQVACLAFSRRQVSERRGLCGFSVRHQHLLLWPLASLHALSFRVSTLVFLWKNWRTSGVDCVVVALSWAFWLGIPCLLAGWDGLLHFVLISWFASLYMAAAFLWNHVGAHHSCGGEHLPFFAQRLLGTRNLRADRWTTFLLGGLNFHLEHHLAPTAPSLNLPRARRILVSVCARYRLPYSEVGYTDALADVYRHLRAIALHARARACTARASARPGTHALPLERVAGSRYS